MSFKAQQGTILLRNEIQRRNATRPKEPVHKEPNAPIIRKKDFNYLGKFSPSSSEVCESLWKLTSSNVIGPGPAHIRTCMTRLKNIIKE